MIYWPGTKIVKSMNNAFTSWQNTQSVVTSSKEWKASEASKRQMSTQQNKSFTIYSKAQASK
jgi:Fe-S cluster biosynthesis and repair protein YggX